MSQSDVYKFLKKNKIKYFHFIMMMICIVICIILFLFIIEQVWFIHHNFPTIVNFSS